MLQRLRRIDNAAVAQNTFLVMDDSRTADAARSCPDVADSRAGNACWHGIVCCDLQEMLVNS